MKLVPEWLIPVKKFPILRVLDEDDIADKYTGFEHLYDSTNIDLLEPWRRKALIDYLHGTLAAYTQIYSMELGLIICQFNRIARDKGWTIDGT